MAYLVEWIGGLVVAAYLGLVSYRYWDPIEEVEEEPDIVLVSGWKPGISEGGLAVLEDTMTDCGESRYYQTMNRAISYHQTELVRMIAKHYHSVPSQQRRLVDSSVLWMGYPAAMELWRGLDGWKERVPDVTSRATRHGAILSGWLDTTTRWRGRDYERELGKMVSSSIRTEWAREYIRMLQLSPIVLQNEPELIRKQTELLCEFWGRRVCGFGDNNHYLVSSEEPGPKGRWSATSREGVWMRGRRGGVEDPEIVAGLQPAPSRAKSARSRVEH